jgi:putative hemolysin
MMAGALEQVRSRIDRNFLTWKLYQKNQNEISAKIQLSIVTSKYTVRIADSNEDFQKIMRLRYEVFTRETRQKENIIRVDLDEFDFVADHLIVEEAATGNIVGTYRLISSPFSKKFYSEAEFEIDEFLNRPGVKLELGRTCIQKEHRRGIVISLLWRGIIEYACKIKARYLFGCASLWSNEVLEAAKVYRAFKDQDYLSTDLEVAVTEKYTHPEYRHDLGLNMLGNENAEVPSLLRSYLKAGAKICSSPAYDEEFRCFDYFVLMDLFKMDATFQARFSS